MTNNKKIQRLSSLIGNILNALIAAISVALLLSIYSIFNTATTPVDIFSSSENYYEAVNFFISAPGFDIMNLDITDIAGEQSKALILVTAVVSLLFYMLLGVYLLSMKKVTTTINADTPFAEGLQKATKHLIIFMVCIMILETYFQSLFTNFIIAPFFSNLLFGDAPLSYLKDNLSFNIDLFLIVEIMALMLIYHCTVHAISLQRQADETL